MESLVFLLLILLLQTASLVQGEIVGAFVLPHGAIAADPNRDFDYPASGPGAISKAWALHDACAQVGERIGSLAPDLLLLSTPHGIADLSHYAFFVNSKGSGFFEETNVSIEMDRDLSLSLIDTLQESNEVTGISGYGDAEAFPLRWGEVLPLSFVIPSLPPLTRTVILSQPAKQFTQSVLPELLKLGSDLYSYLEPLQERVVVIISADLAHTHLASGPYGYSSDAAPFDQAIGDWASTLHRDSLLVTAARHAGGANSCGYTGLVMLQGLMEAKSGGAQSWGSKVFAGPYHPSYYGMMVAEFYIAS